MTVEAYDMRRPNIPGTPSVAPIGRLSFEVVGLHFGDSK